MSKESKEQKATLANELEVEVATLHQPIHLAGFGSTDKTLMKNKFRTKDNFRMLLLPQGLLIQLSGERYVIPHAAVGSYKLAKEA